MQIAQEEEEFWTLYRLIVDRYDPDPIFQNQHINYLDVPLTSKQHKINFFLKPQVHKSLVQFI